jgi:multidrug efflux pump subunit AcrA (membrane-fusion protein)
MIRKYLLPVIATGMLLFAVLYVVRAQQEPPEPPPLDPARTPFLRTVAGAGIVESQTENISVGSALPGVVKMVAVKVGQIVQADDILFELDDRQLKAELEVRKAALMAAEAQLKKQENLPRPEELPASAAKVREAEANLADKVDQYERARVLFSRRAIAEEDRNQRRQAVAQAREQLARARADYALLKAGAWEPDKAIARAAVIQARAQVAQTQTELERLKARSPVAGQVLQVTVHPGEFVGAQPGQAMILLGNIRDLHVRVEIDEHDAVWFQPSAPAAGYLRGRPQDAYPLEFVRVEPYIVPKKSLTGDNTERIDTRVLQVIYKMKVQPDSGHPVYVGQQLDVFIDTSMGKPLGI